MTEERYPGTSRRIGAKPEGPERTDWGRPKVYNVGGVATEFYTVGQVAAALNRSPVTIRKWERLNVIPVAPFRSPAQVRKQARRLYTRSQLEALVQIAWEEGLMKFTRGKDGLEYPVVNVGDTKFTERVRAAFRALADG